MSEESEWFIWFIVGMTNWKLIILIVVIFTIIGAIDISIDIRDFDVISYAIWFILALTFFWND